MSRIQPSRPPLPTREQVANAPLAMPGPGLVYFVKKFTPSRSLDRGRCVGRAPHFDADQLDTENRAEYRARLKWAAAECEKCPIKTRCAEELKDTENPEGIWAGEIHGRDQVSHQKHAA